MTEEKTLEKEKSFATINARSFVVVVIILSCMIALCGILSLFIPQGSFLRGENGEIIAGTFVQSKPQGISFWKIITAPVRVFFVDGSLTIIMICLFLLIMSGVFNLLDKTGGVKTIMCKIVKRYDTRKKRVICLTILFFMLFGSLFGLFEELVTLLPIITVFMLSLGFDTMTGLGVCLLAACFGFSAAITNPFSVGIASSFAGVSTMNGVWFRIIFFVITYGVVCAFVFNHIKKISKKPELSYTYKEDNIKRQILKVEDIEGSEKENRTFKVYLWFFIVQLVALVLIASIRAISGFAIPILSVTFLVGGIISGLLVVDEKKTVFKYLGKGVVSMLPAVLLIALASSVNLVMTESGIIDTIMNAVINFLQGKSIFVCLLLIYLLILILQIFIGSASAKIFLIMPILIPICQVMGISPSLLILVYCIADGFSDVILPTNPVLLIALSMTNISYGKWVKWTWKIQFAMLLISVAVLFLGVQIGL